MTISMTSTRTRRGPARWLTAAILAFLLALATACGGESDSGADLPSAGGATTAAADPDEPNDPESIHPEDAMLKYAQCMREHGVDMADPGPDGRITIQGDDPAVMEAAEEACEELRKAAIPEDGEGPEISEEDKQAMLDMAQCMRDKGYDFPDPVFEGGGIRQRIGGGEDLGFDPEDPTFQADMQECHTQAGLEAPEFNREES